jgi:N-acetylmuramoyl-L-alanine amidase
MRIRNHRLQQDDGTPIRFVATDKKGGALDQQYLVMHYTAGSSLSGAVETLANAAVKASAHLVIDRDGSIVQIVPFDRVAWHAGKSRWHGLSGLNAHSIGIELVNAGKLERQNGHWRAWFGKTYDDDDVLVATHKHETTATGWHIYPEAQLAATVEVAQLLVDRYGLRDVIGHDDIAPGRKADPGPAFPLEQVRGQAMGRRDDAPEVFETVTNLNLRSGPGTGFDKQEASPLVPGTRLVVLAREASWCAVDVLDDAGTPEHSGWVHGDFIRPV